MTVDSPSIFYRDLLSVRFCTVGLQTPFYAIGLQTPLYAVHPDHPNIELKEGLDYRIMGVVHWRVHAV